MSCGPTGVGLNRCKNEVSNYLNTFMAGCHKHKLIKPHAHPVMQRYIYSFFHSDLQMKKLRDQFICATWFWSPSPPLGLSSSAARYLPTCQKINTFWPVADKINGSCTLPLQNPKFSYSEENHEEFQHSLLLPTSVLWKHLQPGLSPFKKQRASHGLAIDAFPKAPIPIWVINRARDDS